MSENYSNNTAFEEEESNEDLPEVTGEMLEGLKTLEGSKKVLEELYIMRNINEKQSTWSVKVESTWSSFNNEVLAKQEVKPCLP